MHVIRKGIPMLLIGILILSNTVFAQPIVEWNKNFGGANSDRISAIEKTLDGGVIVAGSSHSDGGDVSGNNGGQDAWIVKLDNDGNIEWDKNYGGSENDGAIGINQTVDGGFIVVGYSRSSDGDVAGNNGEIDSWIIKLTNDGIIQWEKTYGGSDDDLAIDIVEANNGYAVLCYSHSNDGDVGGNNGLRDFWILKLDNYGNLEWEENFGGSTYETPSSIELASTGGYIISGYSGSYDGDVGGNNGSNDTWLVKLDDDGNLEWERNYGGSGNDVSYHMEKTIDEGYILAGRSQSNDGDVEGNNGEHDLWILKLDADGNIEWGKTYGGTQDDEAQSIKQTPAGNYIVAGNSDSIDGDVGGNNGDEDNWILKLDSDGNLIWGKNFGGSGTDSAEDVVAISDDIFFVASWTESDDGDLTGNNGASDYWLIKIDPMIVLVQEHNFNSNVMISPNPSNGACSIQLDITNAPSTVQIFGAMGKTIYRNNEVQGSLNIDDLPKGILYIKIENDEFSITRKLIVL